MCIGEVNGPGFEDAAAHLSAGSGEMRARYRTQDWAATPLAPVAG